MKRFIPSLLVAGWLPLVAGAAGLNDTGVDYCSVSDTANSRDATECATASADNGVYPRQDSRFGRSAMDAAGVLYKKGGSATKGRDYTKICNSGEEAGKGSCPANTDPGMASIGDGANQWGCTRDNVTGLIWETKTASGLRNYGQTYTWYNSDSSVNGSTNSTTNDGAGTENGGDCVNKYNATTNPTGNKCDTQGYVAAINAAGLCGANEWRMPTFHELLELIDAGRSGPVIDSAWFPNTPNTTFWTVSPSADQAPNKAWSIGFGNGGTRAQNKSNSYLVRLVRKPQ